jgi:DNA modification methylase
MNSEKTLNEQLFENCRKYSFEEALDTFSPDHRYIYYCNIGNNKSPAEAWYDDKMLKKAIATQIKYRPDDLSIKMTINRFTIARIAPKPTMFTSALMKRIILTYCPFITTIIDPFAGFGGRAQGAKELNKMYVGYDINSKIIEENNKLGFTNISYRDVLQTKDNTPFDRMITCPPYNLKESWGEKIENKSSLEWAYIAKNAYPNCKKYIFVVDEIDNSCKVLEEIGSKKTDHFHKAKDSKHCKEYIIELI